MKPPDADSLNSRWQIINSQFMIWAHSAMESKHGLFQQCEDICFDKNDKFWHLDIKQIQILHLLTWNWISIQQFCLSTTQWFQDRFVFMVQIWFWSNQTGLKYIILDPPGDPEWQVCYLIEYLPRHLQVSHITAQHIIVCSPIKLPLVAPRGCCSWSGWAIDCYTVPNWRLCKMLVGHETNAGDHFVYEPSQWETMLQCNIVSHWLSTCTEMSLKCSAS